MPFLLTRAYRRLRFGRPVIVVSGLPRSGTSMLMRMLAEGGLPIVADTSRAADDSNPLGYFEDSRVERLNTDPDTRWLADARGRAIKIISFLLTYLPATLNYRVIFVHRDLSEVVASQDAMLARRGQEADPAKTVEVARAWEEHLRKVKAFLARNPHFEVLDVDYNAVIADAAPQAARVNRFLGGRLDERRMIAAVDQQLYRNRLAGQDPPVRTRS